MTGGRLMTAAFTAVMVLTTSLSACRPDEHPRLTVEEATSLFDAPLHIRISDARPGEHLVLNAHATDRHGVRWSSSSTFVADSAGAIDVASAAPVAGNYTSVSATGP